jgi:DNA polymerase III subunit epsilon
MGAPVREVILDTETTGFRAGDDRICSISLLEIVDLVPTGEYVTLFVNPGRPSSEGALKVHQLTDEFLSKMPPFQKVYPAIKKFVGDARLVGHNLPFDQRFVCADSGDTRFATPGACTLALAKDAKAKVIAGAPADWAGNKLDDLVRQFGIMDLRAATSEHGSFIDCLLTAQVYYALRTGGLDHRILQAVANILKFEDIDVDLSKQSPSRTGLPPATENGPAPVAANIRDVGGRDRENIQRPAGVHHAPEAGRAEPVRAAAGDRQGGSGGNLDRVTAQLRDVIAGLS